MSVKSKAIILFVGWFVFVGSACYLGSGGSTETRDDIFDVGDSPRVIVISDNGPVLVTSGPDGKISVKATLRKPNDIEYEIAQVAM